MCIDFAMFVLKGTIHASGVTADSLGSIPTSEPLDLLP